MVLLLLFVFILVPITEIALFIEVGSWIGLWPTLAVIALTAIVGANLVARQGLAVLTAAQESLARGEAPLDAALHGIFLLISGFLLLTPGFLTDVIGFTLLVPGARLAIAHWLINRMTAAGDVNISIQNFQRRGRRREHQAHSKETDIIDVEYEEIDRPDRRP